MASWCIFLINGFFMVGIMGDLFLTVVPALLDGEPHSFGTEEGYLYSSLAVYVGFDILWLLYCALTWYLLWVYRRSGPILMIVGMFFWYAIVLNHFLGP